MIEVPLATTTGDRIRERPTYTQNNKSRIIGRSIRQRYGTPLFGPAAPALPASARPNIVHAVRGLPLDRALLPLEGKLFPLFTHRYCWSSATT